MFSYIFDKLCNTDRLQMEILANSSIGTALSHIETSSEPEKTAVWFKARLTPEEFIWLTNIINKHVKPLPDVINIDIQEKDTDGAQIVRPKAAKKGWSFWAVPVEITTSTLLGSLVCSLSDGTPIPWVNCKIYKPDDSEILTAGLANINLLACTKTVIDFEPTFDYELIGGALRITSNPGQDVRLWIVGAPDIPAAYGGSKEFASGINLKFFAPNNSFDIDGRVTKYITYDPVTHSGKIRIILRHPAGTAVNMQLVFHLYRL